MECRLGRHKDRLVHGDQADYVKCETCGSRFPCRALLCGHLDCNAERVEPGSMIGGELGFQVRLRDAVI